MYFNNECDGTNKLRTIKKDKMYTIITERCRDLNADDDNGDDNDYDNCKDNKTSCGKRGFYLQFFFPIFLIEGPYN